MNGRKFTAVPILVGNTKSKTDEEYGRYGVNVLRRLNSGEKKRSLTHFVL